MGTAVPEVWETEGDLDFLPDDEEWRGSEHIADWPEDDYLNGEYGLYLDDLEDEE